MCDAQGRLEYTYDGPVLLSEAWSGAVSGSVERSLDDDFRIDTLKVNGATVATLGYDEDSLLTSAGSLVLQRDPQTGLLEHTTLGLVTDGWTYSSFAEPQSYAAQIDGDEVFAVSYDERDKLGRIKKKTETIEGMTTAYEYDYDDRGRLREVKENGVVATTYSYDDNGNRLSRVRPGETCTYSYDGQDRLLSYDCGAGAVSFTYTANGELASKTEGSDTTTYEYDAAGNLRGVDLPNGDEIEYLIDGRDRRIGKAINGVVVQKFLYLDQLNPVAELDGNVIATFVYGSKGHVPDFMLKGGVTYRVISDHLGSTRLVLDGATGSIAQRLDYDEFGSGVVSTESAFQPFGFAGGLDDSDTGLVRFGARDYDPTIGRWTTKDPIGFRAGAANLYGYVGADPINRIDPSGLSFWGSVVDGVVVGVIGGAIVTGVALGGVALGVPATIVTGGLAVASVIGGAITVASLWADPSADNFGRSVGTLAGAGLIGGLAGRTVACRLSPLEHQPPPGWQAWSPFRDASQVWSYNRAMSLVGNWNAAMATGPNPLSAAGAIVFVAEGAAQ